MRLEDELDYLNKMLFKMSDVVTENITDAIAFFLGKKKVESINDDLVDKYERLIEELCINILLKERPYASDLKEVTGILKLVADVERIGDHAEDIYLFAVKLEDCNEKRIEIIDELSTCVLKMLKDSMVAYVNKDVALAQRIIDEDDYVDKQYEKAIELLASSTTELSNKYLSFAIYTTLVVKYLERIADHCVNIAEWVIYIVNGYHKDKRIC